MYDELFKPMDIGSMTLKNRFVVPAMDTKLATREHFFTQRAFSYYAKRVEGGFGLIVTEYLCVSPEGIASEDQAGIYDDAFIPTLSQLTARVREKGGKIVAQLHHSGRARDPKTCPLPAVGPSAVAQVNMREVVHELTGDEINEVIGKFADSAVRAQKAGFDGVELHAAHGYLLCDFLSKSANKRCDAYGGSVTNRARIVREIIRRIKERCGDAYPVIVKINSEETKLEGNSVTESAAIAVALEAGGADAIEVSVSSPIRTNYEPAGFNLANAKRIRESLRIPVIAMGRINDAALAAQAIRSGCCDFVALGRQSICDPEFPNKVKENRLDEIMVCTGCTQRCLHRSSFESADAGISCMINPLSGKESVWTLNKSETPKRILVAGGGPSGLQCAWILAKRGHNVVILEKANRLGGQYNLLSVPPMKQDFGKTVQTLTSLCRKHGVEIHLNTPANAETMRQYAPDIVVAANGSVPLRLPAEGVNQANLITAQDVLGGRVVLAGKRVLVLGMGLVGIETADFLASYQNRVEVVGMEDKPIPTVSNTQRRDIIARLARRGIALHPGCKVQAFCSDGVVALHGGVEKRLLGFEATILALGAKADDSVREAARLTGYEFYAIGDAQTAGNAMKAIYEATKLAVAL